MESQNVSIWELSDLRTPWCIFVVATLDIAGHLAEGRNNLDQLAQAAACDKDVLHAILGHLVSHGVFSEPAPGVFALNDAASPLLDPITRLSLNLEDIGGRFAHAWGTLLQLTRTGKPAYQQAFGLSFWQDLEAHPALAGSFDALIGPPGHGIPNSEFQLSAGWESIHTLVDVGGGTGAMLAEILRTQPHLHGILVDLPRTVSRSDEIFRAAGVTERVKTVGQSLFDPLPKGADLYLLRGVLNDWPDAEAVQILAGCARAASPSGRVVVLKSVGPDDAQPELTIEMVLVGGKHRTIAQFTGLALQAGLKVIASGLQPSDYYVVECVPL